MRGFAKFLAKPRIVHHELSGPGMDRLASLEPCEKIRDDNVTYLSGK